MRNPVTIPLTKDKKRNLIIDLESVTSIIDMDYNDNKSTVVFVENNEIDSVSSEFTAAELYEEICSPSK